MKSIALPSGRQALVDDEDYDELTKYRWQFSNGYAVRFAGPPGQRELIAMHRVVSGALRGEDTDHVDLNRLNNQRANLRPATRSQNIAHRGLIRTNTSGFKGVSWKKSERRWVSVITVKGKKITLGYFRSKEDAAFAYDAMAVQCFGPFAITNAMLRGEAC